MVYFSFPKKNKTFISCPCQSSSKSLLATLHYQYYTLSLCSTNFLTNSQKFQNLIVMKKIEMKSSNLDLSLDDIINKNKAKIRSDRGLTGTGAGTTVTRDAVLSSEPGDHCVRRFVNREQTRPSPYPMRASTMMPIRSGGGFKEESEAKIYISNLHYAVSTTDIQLLFSDVGELRSQSIHYDRSGRSKGTAEVVFARRIDALAAIKKYNNLPLDGKPMVLELVGGDLLLHSTETGIMAEPVDTVFNRLSRDGGREDIDARGWRHSGLCDREFTQTRDQGRDLGEKPTAEDLNADMERYRLEAINLKKLFR
ncbi:THO complex subunit 4A-like [Mercurialis annua]|uniref:THO complex subunit 4A-like n=1 Tax=Mercurialis annua TaxID=3986 RepID=UPI0024AFFFF1|nr:THO complex subunit 4A-like [Mercurialis annua]